MMNKNHAQKMICAPFRSSIAFVMLRTKAADPAAVAEASTIQIEVVRFAKEVAVGPEY